MLSSRRNILEWHKRGNRIDYDRNHPQLAEPFSLIQPLPVTTSQNLPRLIVVCGPTATGKSGLALKLTERWPTAILSADSRLVYRGLDIGTAKPTATDQAKIPHYLIDICEPTETLTLADYQAQAQQLINTLPSPLFLVGGTGLYLKAITKGLKIPRVAPQEPLREQCQKLGQSFCYQLLTQVDPIAAQKSHAQDVVRTLRALEVFYVTGRPISQQQGENPPPYPILQIGLACEPELLQQRITHRTQQMLEMGLISEVQHLMQQYGQDLPLLNTLGYAEIRDYLSGQLTLDQAIAAIILHTRQFAKRQRTWFRAVPEIHWFNADAPDLVEQVEKAITEFLS